MRPRLRLNWFSPLPPARTDIAHYTGRIADALRERFDVAFWTPAGADVDPDFGPVRTFDVDAPMNKAMRRDLIAAINVYNIGNDARFHREIFILSQRFPGFVVMHDTVLHHFVFEMDRAAGGSNYIAAARAQYGEEGAAKARRAVEDGGASLDSIVLDMPFTGYVLDNAIGAICHSEQAAADIHSTSPTRAYHLPLPFESGVPDIPDARDWRAPFRLVLFGFLGSNRGVEAILEALAGLKARDAFELDVIGTAQDETRLRALLAQPTLAGRARFHGFAPEADLDAAIARAHLAFNLRFPTMGEASGGILRAWRRSTPAMVSNAGWYAGLPDDIAVKVPADNPPEAIRRALASLLECPEAFRTMGEGSRRFLDAQHRPGAYGRGLEEIFGLVGPLSGELARRKAYSRALMTHAARVRSGGGHSGGAGKDHQIADPDPEAR